MDTQDISARITSIGIKLKLASDRGCAPFGSTRHKMRTNPPLNEEQVAAVEDEYGVRLPEQYRMFITQLGDGGAGPAYGLLPLSQALEPAREYAADRFLSTPFPHRAAYFPVDPTDEEEASMADEEFWKLQALQMAGTLLLSEQGCGYEDVLVVSGPEHGTIWLDARVSDQGVQPLGIGFLDWYENWLDNTLLGEDHA